MINNKKIIVVLPAYNAGKTLQKTFEEIPFDVVDEVIPLTGNPVALVRVTDEGVPSVGVVRIGDVKVLFVSVSVFEAVDLSSNCV